MTVRGNSDTRYGNMGNYVPSSFWMATRAVAVEKDTSGSDEVTTRLKNSRDGSGTVSSTTVTVTHAELVPADTIRLGKLMAR